MRNGARSENAESGFTLLELIVVLVLAVLLLALVPPLISSAMPGAEINGAARKIAAGLRYTRSRAVATQQEQALVVDLEQRSFTVPGRKQAVNLPSSLHIKLLTTRADLQNERLGGIRFFPDGSSTGGRVTLKGDGSEYVIDVQWLTGKVTILD